MPPAALVSTSKESDVPVWVPSQGPDGGITLNGAGLLTGSGSYAYVPIIQP